MLGNPQGCLGTSFAAPCSEGGRGRSNYCESLRAGSQRGAHSLLLRPVTKLYRNAKKTESSRALSDQRIDFYLQYGVPISGSLPTIFLFHFLCQSVSLVDEESDQKAIKEAEKSKWTTKRGFQYPPIKTRKELLQHPKRLHEARIEDLRQPYEHFEENPS